MMLVTILIGLGMGVVFGVALEKSRVFEPGVLVRQFQFRTFIMLKVFLTAVATGAVVLAVLNGLGIVELAIKGTLLWANVVGGLILGAGIALAGACPGTVLAQIGAGYRDAWAVLVGGILGAMVFAYLEPALKPLLDAADFGKASFHDWLGVPFWLLAPVFAAALIAAVVALERWRPWRSELGDDVDGLPSGSVGRP
jgi:uncharacterized protein